VGLCSGGTEVLRVLGLVMGGWGCLGGSVLGYNVTLYIVNSHVHIYHHGYIEVSHKNVIC